jgi:hypothetical protein
MSSTPPAAVQGYIDAGHAFDGDALTGWLAGDAFVYGTRREFCGKDAIRAWLDREIIGDKVTTDPAATAGHCGEVIFVYATDGECDKSRLPDPLVITCYFTVNDGPHRAADHHPQPADASAGEALGDMPGRKDWPCR